LLGTFNLNQGVFTTMTYNDGFYGSPFGPNPSGVAGGNATPMALDIALMQRSYGVNTNYNGGDTVYTIQTTASFFQAIWDTGGVDTIQYNGSGAVTIDLRAATLLNAVGGGGFVSYAHGVHSGFTIANGVVIENATGGNGEDTLIGNDANNVLNGGAGGDTMRGGLGDDTYYVNTFSDFIVEDLGAGTDTIIATLSFTLFDNVENLILTGAALNGTGNGSSNAITGNDNDNTLNGGAGADTLIGGNGNDQLFGGDGDDFLWGGAGTDTLNGGAGADEANFGSELRRSYSFDSGAVTLTPNQGYPGDTVSSVERLVFFDGSLIADAGDEAAQIFRIYQAALGRTADSMGLSNWTAARELGGLSLLDVAAAFTGSAEFELRYGPSLTNEEFVDLLYQNVLGRDPDPQGEQYWVGLLSGGATRAEVLIGFSESQENVQLTLSAITAGLWVQDLGVASIARLYDTAFDRLPDAAGLVNWSLALEGGMDILTIADQFVNSLEFTITYGALSNSEFVELLYLNVLNRESDPVGAANWINALNNDMSRAEAVLQFSESLEHILLQAPYIDQGIWFGG
jgi:hypothetical protein